MVFPLRDAGMGKSDVIKFNADRGIVTPRRNIESRFFQRLIE